MAEVDLKPAYLIAGSDSPKVEAAVRRLRRHFTSEAVEIVSAVDVPASEVVMLCNAGSLFGDRRLVVVEEVDGRRNAEGQLRGGWKVADVATIVEYIGAPAPGTVLALVAAGVGRDAALAKAVSAFDGLLVYDIDKRKGLQQWIGERFQSLGVRAEPDACAALLHLVGDDPHALAREVEKIATWAAGEPIGEREVEELTAAMADTPAWRITDAWGRRDLAATLELSETLLERSARPLSVAVPIVAATLGKQVGVVRRAKQLDDRGVRSRDAIKELGVRLPFQADRAFQAARNFSEVELDDALVRVAELDHALKGGSRLALALQLQLALVDLGRTPAHPGARRESAARG